MVNGVHSKKTRILSSDPEIIVLEALHFIVALSDILLAARIATHEIYADVMKLTKIKYRTPAMLHISSMSCMKFTDGTRTIICGLIMESSDASLLVSEFG